MTAQRLVLSIRPHFIIAIAFGLLLTYMASSNDREVRILLIAPAIILFFSAFVAYGFEYDSMVKLNAALKASQGRREPQPGSRAQPGRFGTVFSTAE